MGACLRIRIAVLAASAAVLMLTGMTSIAVAVRPHASPTFVGNYAGSDAEGRVSFTLGGAANEVPGKRPFYTYDLYNLRFATECSRSGTRLPGAILLSHHRRHASEQERFTYRSHGFVIRGLLYGPLVEPKFKGTVKVIRRRCDGDSLSWTAKLVP